MKQEELRNGDKMTKNLYFEYERLQKRLEVVSQPDYLPQLIRKQAELDKRITILAKDKKTLEIEQQRREKKLDRIIGKEEPE